MRRHEMHGGEHSGHSEEIFCRLWIALALPTPTLIGSDPSEMAGHVTADGVEHVPVSALRGGDLMLVRPAGQLRPQRADAAWRKAMSANPLAFKLTYAPEDGVSACRHTPSMARHSQASPPIAHHLSGSPEVTSSAQMVCRFTGGAAA